MLLCFQRDSFSLIPIKGASYVGRPSCLGCVQEAADFLANLRFALRMKGFGVSTCGAPFEEGLPVMQVLRGLCSHELQVLYFTTDLSNLGLWLPPLLAAADLFPYVISISL
jgi:hypothetical protein